ncbi:MAG TPA: glucose-6-phosphate isomerase [Thiobacillus sp.]|nr:MAG: glucose-6-phosphate isomerase [Hydrogenophilales bacterium 28-61-11]OYZ57895.1 MAG: glucose-6-phosphate isomerase [Hydrogenophilales bacterium 16-61-112]OZA45253.1 MAG: glucose-6-phosphate isomerase [Hydrogenophilales bacterium 17-61-76]HQT32128.1 glucose-6-phosphate isomerase [Thiobacillus sp.]HQT69178.1 glucose-6-phosphate isomerase [Thiobacillus sp.]
MTPLKQLPSWKILEQHFKSMRAFDMRTAFREDAHRFDHLSLRCGNLLLDYSKNRITVDTMSHLMQLARESDLEGMRNAMYSGERINFTERRAVLHMALRAPTRPRLMVEGVDVEHEVSLVLKRMQHFVESIHNGSWRGHTGKPIRDVVNIGIGGSDLGPAMVCAALDHYALESVQVHFVSNLDPAHLASTLKHIDPETTLFIVASKTFTTLETLANANSAKAWLLAALRAPAAVARHFVALSTNMEAVEAFGIDPENMFIFWDWVGGRYSLWSAIGLSIALQIGWGNFQALLAGAHAMDVHFKEAPLEANMPVILGMLGIWYGNFWETDTHGIFPYDQRLRLLVPFLQQLDMESNGKNVNRANRLVNYNTGPIVWGAPGTNGQHAFFELIHQGTRLIPTDFLMAAVNHTPLADQHEWLLANCMAQSEALLKGKSRAVIEAELIAQGMSREAAKALAPHKVFPGNRPSNTLLYQKLDPHTLGMLLALYEHKIFVQGIVWQINSFDQWGVELGKQLAPPIRAALSSVRAVGEHDGSTQGLIADIRRRRGLST